jgi:hypothetical protein
MMQLRNIAQKHVLRWESERREKKVREMRSKE